ncbi:YbaB/EbfC family nucleoid-associated protein [Micromonospora sonneratiae]|uniref:YbaB/EbfC family nucleoid-associated protein n=1 Tax=Micromonospora sonneratiae TaxID=1184706 RepID=A0ABW3YD04_9ACTN
MDLAAMRAYADELTARFEKLRAGATEMRARITAVEATATSDDGFVTVVVDYRGHVKRVDIDPRIYRRPDSKRLAETLTSTIRRAIAESNRLMTEVASEHVPAEEFQTYHNLELDTIFGKLDEQFDAVSKGELR